MAAINIDNISEGLSAVQNIKDQLQEVSTYTYVDPEFIHFSVDNPYSDNDTEEEIHDLALSIDACGLINPITLNKKSDTEYILISGEKRYKAITTYLHWKSIPATVFEGLSDEKAQLMLHEANLAVRQYTNEEKLTYYEKVKKYVDVLIEKGEYRGGRQKKIAKMLGVTTRQIRTYETITENLSESEIDKVKLGGMSMNEAYNKASEIKKSGTTSASTSDDTDTLINVPLAEQEAFWNNELESFVKKRFGRDSFYYSFYVFNVPTSQEAVKKIKEYNCHSESAGSKYGRWIGTNKGFTHIPASGGNSPFNGKQHHYSYTEVDKMIRELIAYDELIDEEEIKKVLLDKIKTLGVK